LIGIAARYKEVEIFSGSTRRMRKNFSPYLDCWTIMWVSSGRAACAQALRQLTVWALLSLLKV
jgi:hypothetical protein